MGISPVNMLHLIVDAINQFPQPRSLPIVLPKPFNRQATMELQEQFRQLHRRFVQTRLVVEEVVHSEAMNVMTAQALVTSITVLGHRIDQLRNVVAPSPTTSLVPTPSPANTSVQLEFSHLTLKNLQKVCERCT